MKVSVYIEACVIGIICCVLLAILNSLIDNLIFLLFLIGFIKHFCGYYFGLQTYYCKKNLNLTYVAVSNNIIVEAILEGLIFIYFGLLLTKIITNKYILIFILGFIIHIFAELYGIHNLFLKVNCKIKK